MSVKSIQKKAFYFTMMICVMVVGLLVYHQWLTDHILDRIEHERSTVNYFQMADTDPISKRIHRISDHTPNHFVKAAERSTSSVVYIIAYEKVEGSFFSEGFTREKGSGVIISEDGYIVTNYHVVKDADFIEITLEDKREFVAEVIGTDESTDLALLKIEAKQLPSLVFANSDSLQVGEWILAIGNPFGLKSTVTAGIVSAKARSIDALSKNDIESFIQTDAVINPGSSGGALVNTDGLLMGIFTAIISSNGNYEGLSFAIPSNLARKVIIDLKEFGSVQRGKLGISVTDVNADIAKKLKLNQITGVHVSTVNLNSAAAEGGLKKNDVIIAIDGIDIKNSSSFYEVINQYRPGDKLTLQFIRKNQISEQSITLRNHLNTTDYISVRSDKELRELGIEIRDLNSIEKARINSEGIMIISISKGSVIANTNMEPGFIVEYFNDQKVNTTQEFIKLLKETTGSIKLMGFYERYPGRYPYTFER